MLRLILTIGLSEGRVQRVAAAQASSTQLPTGHNNPTALGTTTTQAEVTLLSAAGGHCMTLAAPRDADSRSEAAPLKPSLPLIKDGSGMLVREAGYNWL